LPSDACCKYALRAELEMAFAAPDPTDQPLIGADSASHAEVGSNRHR
jgi:hypothetical protein